MAGLKDVLDTHFWEKFGSALAVSLIGAGAQVAQPQQSAFSATSPSSAATGAFTQNMSQFGIEQARAGQSRPNTIELRSGLELTIKPNHDITLPPYVGERGAGPANLISARWKQ
jgi:type IV secretion system protein TrbI